MRHALERALTIFSTLPDDGSHLDPRAVQRFAELVKKIGTSPSLAEKRRRKSRQKKLRRALQESANIGKRENRQAFALTLTYRRNEDFSPKHISRFVDSVRRWLKGFAHTLLYAWVLEREGRLHYHLIFWVPRGFMFDFCKLGKWWSWGNTWVERCQSARAWGRYMSKFDSVAALPKGARIYGYGGLDSAAKRAIARAGWPRWLQKRLPASHTARRCPEGGWLDLQTGGFIPRPTSGHPWESSL